MKKITGIIAALAVLNGFAFADAKGTEIMTTVADFKKPSFSRSQVIMSLQDKRGSKELQGQVELHQQVRPSLNQRQL